MSHRDFAFVAIERLMVVEQYRDSHQLSSTHPRRGPGVDRTDGQANTTDSRSGSRAPARPHQG